MPIRNSAGQIIGMIGAAKPEAAVLATALTGDLSDAWKEKTAAMYTDALGQTDAAFAKQAATYEYTVQMLKNLGQNALTEIGQKLIPYLTEAGQTLLPKVTDALDKLSPVASSVFDNIDWDSLENALDQMLNVSVQLIEQVLPQLGPTLQGATNILNDIWPLVSRIIDALLTLIEYANIGYAMLSGDSGTASAIIANKEAREANAIREKMSDDQKTQAYVQAANRAEKATGATGTKKNVVTVSPPLTGQNTYTFGVGTPAGKAAQIAANASDSITTSGKFGNAIKAVPQATGGIVTRPTFIYAGEGGESEAVLPLSKLDAMLHSSTTNNTQTQTMSFTYAPVIHMHGGNANDVQETLEDGYEEFKRMMYQFERDNDRRKF